MLSTWVLYHVGFGVLRPLLAADSMEPYAWNVIIIGAWNVAILTPDGIRRLLFQLPEGTPVEIEVAIDRPGPFKVVHDGLLVTPLPHALEVAPQKFDLASLQRASDIARRALQSLPQTPVSAAGVNIRYKFPALPDALIELVTAPIDDTFSDAGYVIEGGATKRVLTLNPGVLNVDVSQGKTGEGSVVLNFHRESAVQPELEGWLSKTEDFFGVSKRVLSLIKTEPQERGPYGE
jgi:hypothetical protein